jgi:hypothetical protein
LDSSINNFRPPRRRLRIVVQSGNSLDFLRHSRTSHKVAAVHAEDIHAAADCPRIGAWGPVTVGRRGKLMIDLPTRRRAGDGAPQADESGQGEASERSVQEFPRRDAPFYRKRPAEPPPENVVGHASSIMQRVAVTSVAEIDSLIGELERLRDFVRQESVRIQREIEGYVRLSEEATKSTRIIAESVAQWKNGLEHIAGRSA